MPTCIAVLSANADLGFPLRNASALRGRTAEVAEDFRTFSGLDLRRKENGRLEACPRDHALPKGRETTKNVPSQLQIVVMPDMPDKLKAVLRAISRPAGNERGPLFMDQVLAAIHQGNSNIFPLHLPSPVILGKSYCAASSPRTSRPRRRPALCPVSDVKITPLPDDALDPLATTDIWAANLHLAHDLYPIKRYVQFEDTLSRQTADPLIAIFTAVSGEAMYSPMIELTIRPAGKRRAIRMRRCFAGLPDHSFAAILGLPGRTNG